MNRDVLRLKERRIVKNLQLAIDQSGQSVPEIALAAGMSRGALYQVLVGNRRVTLQTLLGLPM